MNHATKYHYVTQDGRIEHIRVNKLTLQCQQYSNHFNGYRNIDVKIMSGKVTRTTNSYLVYGRHGGIVIKLIKSGFIKKSPVHSRENIVEYSAVCQEQQKTALNTPIILDA